MQFLPTLSLLLALIPTTMLQATENPLTYDRINLSASAQGKVLNDILVAVLYQRVEGPTAEPLAAEVNQAIAAALATAKKVPEVSVQTLDYQTFPTYQNQKVTGWSVRQSIRLESKNIEKLSTLIGEMQKSLKVESISYQVSPENLRATEDGLMSEAMKAFQQRAELITRELGRKRYRLVALDVNTQNSMPRPFHANARAMAMDAAPSAPPAIEAGEQPVTVNLQGTIELQSD
jgi:predicted secreted protein